jgi:hypothetical protein
MFLYVRYVWDTLAGDWIGKTRQQNEFDRQGNQTSYVYENWDKDLPGFVSYQKGFYHKGIYLFRDYDSICSGENLQWQGDLIDTEGTYQKAYLSFSGRDSIYELNLTVNPAPELIHITGQDLVHAYSIYTYSVPQNPDLSYSWWVEGGNQISTPTKNTAAIQWGKVGEGALFARAENSYGCLSDTAGLMVSIGTLHSGEIPGKGITVYPNPVTDILIISSQNPIERIEILDLNGQRVLSSGNQEIDCSKLAPGTYIVRILDHEGAAIGYTRIIKNH